MADFGTDIDALLDLPSRMTIVSGVRNLGNALGRRLITQRGSLSYAPNYGTDVRAYLNAGNTPKQIASIQSQVENECEKDERVVNCTATVTFVNGALSIVLDIETADGPFKFVLLVNQVTATLLEAA